MSTDIVLPPTDANGHPVHVGDRVWIVGIPEWLTHDLPSEDQSRLRTFEGRLATVVEIDQAGYLWFSPPESGFCLRPTDVAAQRPRKPDYDPQDFFEAERLHRAAAEGDIQEMQRLVEQGYALEQFDDLGCAPLHYATEGQHYKAVEWLIAAGANVNANDEAHIGETPLCYAAQSDSPELVELLLRHGADPDIAGWMGQTARIRAAQRRDEHGQQISALIEHHQPVRPNPGAVRKK